jgi:hypothetical protein
MVLPTRVNIINDSSERIKVKIDNDKDRKVDEITNIEPGGRFEVSGSVSGHGNYDVVIDIITNPPGPDNNERHGTFKFDNPAFVFSPYVVSDDYSWTNYPVKLCRECDDDGWIFSERYVRSDDLLRSNWLKGKAQRIRAAFAALVKQEGSNSTAKNLEKLYSEAPRPLVTIEAFMQDNDAKVWDLRIAGDNFVPTFQTIDH